MVRTQTIEGDVSINFECGCRVDFDVCAIRLHGSRWTITKCDSFFLPCMAHDGRVRSYDSNGILTVAMSHFDDELEPLLRRGVVSLDEPIEVYMTEVS